MASISEGAYLSNNLTAVIGLITIIITGLWTLLISKKFTNPITKMNTITKKMSTLDFSETLIISGSDELGQLSHSINQLSSNLDTAITELNMKNKQLERDIDKERSLDKMRREFISNVSHELKTPIFLIQGYSEGLKANVAATEEKRNFYCDVIMEETERMDALVHGLLNLAQLESDTFTMVKTHFNISKLMRGIFLKYAPIFKDKQIKQLLILQEDYMTYADCAQIEQVIINFINNAVDYVDANKIIRLTAFRKDEKLRISIYNSGAPIPQQELEKIWTSFYKIDKARTRDLGGTGLGLSIVRAILDAHKSTYGVFNVEDGVEFWFELPL
jgi:signal transduction histidine kinase